MNITEFDILNSLYNGSIGRVSCSYDINLRTHIKSNDTLDSLVKQGLVSNSFKITELGKQALEPYKVNNAVILAAGASTRFIPLSLEKPKGLYEVKGERIIERQIQQLLDAGINDISVVIG